MSNSLLIRCYNRISVFLAFFALAVSAGVERGRVRAGAAGMAEVRGPPRAGGGARRRHPRPDPALAPDYDGLKAAYMPRRRIRRPDRGAVAGGAWSSSSPCSNSPSCCCAAMVPTTTAGPTSIPKALRWSFAMMKAASATPGRRPPSTSRPQRRPARWPWPGSRGSTSTARATTTQSIDRSRSHARDGPATDRERRPSAGVRRPPAVRGGPAPGLAPTVGRGLVGLPLDAVTATWLGGFSSAASTGRAAGPRVGLRPEWAGCGWTTALICPRRIEVTMDLRGLAAGPGPIRVDQS